MGVFEGVKKGRIYIGKSWLLYWNGGHLTSAIEKNYLNERKNYFPLFSHFLNKEWFKASAF